MRSHASGNESRDRQHSAQHHPGGSSSHGYLVLSMDAAVSKRTAVVSIIMDLIPEGKHENTSAAGCLTAAR